MILSDNGTEFTSNAILAWQEELGLERHYIAPGKPMQALSKASCIDSPALLQRT
jgi:transposase InsO family protein